MTSTPLPPLPTGRQHVLELGDQRAVVAAVGASLREYTVGGRDVVLPYPEDAMAPAFSGTVLAPWPNRLRDGEFRFEGVTYDVPLNEHDRQTALHGLVAHTTFSTVDESADSVALELVIVPTHGYPWPVRIRVTYSLTSDGLRVQTDVTNLGTSTAPFGLGFHPWLSPGDGPVDEATLQVDAARHVTVDTRLLPTGTEALAGRYDLRAVTPLRGIALDDAWVQPDPRRGRADLGALRGFRRTHGRHVGRRRLPGVAGVHGRLRGGDQAPRRGRRADDLHR